MQCQDLIEIMKQKGNLTQKNVEDAIRQTPRHLFVSDEYLKEAYYDEPIPTKNNQTISHPSVVARMTEWFDVKPDDKILEIGCGRGAGGVLINRAFQPAQLHLLDLDFSMVRLARRQRGHSRTPRHPLWVADSVCLPFRAATFDAVFGFGFLHHVPRWQQALSEITRVLKPHGLYYAEELFPGLYQNAVTRRLLVHPEHDRFEHTDFLNGLRAVHMHLLHAVALNRIGILCIAAKFTSG